MSNYPDGMSRRDLMHVGEIAPDWCEDCPCVDEAEKVDEQGDVCSHEDECECESCDCGCHAEPDYDDFPDDDGADYDAGR
jgi:hypothetical protein